MLLTMEQEPCSVCGGMELSLADGFYYCVECGTQNTAVQEMVVDHATLRSGTFAHTAKKKFTTVKDEIEMSGEWRKWHAYNFILCALADELVALGAAPSFKTKVLWVWTRYIKRFQDKDELRRMNKSHFLEENDSDGENDSQTKKPKPEKFTYDIKIVTKAVLTAILYVALNLDRSEIQLSHLMRFIKERRLSVASCTKFIPKELNKNTIPFFHSFVNSLTRENSHHTLKCTAMTLFKCLKLGTPLVPDLRKFVDDYVTELCLPKGFKDLVFSLMHLVPCNFLNINSSTQNKLIKIPDYEGVTMAYVLVALKMCFGLDDEYEITVANAVDKINEQENRLKSHKLGYYSDKTDRLFSFREWHNFIQFRKTVLSQYYLPIAFKYKIDMDEYICMEQLPPRNRRKVELRDEVTMDILNKIPDNHNVRGISKDLFLPSLTPFSTYTKVILEFVQDPDFQLLLSEDFTQYSLKYACEQLKLLEGTKNVIKGVGEANKIKNPNVLGLLGSKKADFSMVFVRNCENENWLNTKPPNEQHITIKLNDAEAEKDSDHRYNSKIENINEDYVAVEDKIIISETQISDVQQNHGMRTEESIKEKIIEDNSVASDIKVRDECRVIDTIEEEDTNINIFDDDFEDLYELEKKAYILSIKPVEEDIINFEDDDIYPQSEPIFNPKHFNQDNAIRDLILSACEKYKIPKPKEYNPFTSRKRIYDLVHIGAESKPKKRKTESIQPKSEEFNKIMLAYYKTLEKGIIRQVEDHVKSVVEIVLEENVNSSVVNQNDNFNDMNDKVRDQNEEHGIALEQDNEDESDTSSLLQKRDPNFDEKTHDLKQLYVNLQNELDLDDIFDIDDPKIHEILDMKILQSNEKAFEPLPKDEDVTKIVYDSDEFDSEDDVPLSVLKERNTEKQRIKKLRPLAFEIEHIKEYKYWLRHYPSQAIGKRRDLQGKFSAELSENFPKSFTFVIYECASILEYTPFSLYRCMQDLEKKIISRLKSSV